MTGYLKATVRSADGTVIGYRQFGRGPAVLIVHGGMKASQHFMKLANVLAADFTVAVPDRRGRGLSGPHGPDHGIMREVEDLQALVAATGATRIFGHSVGALATLRTARLTPSLHRIALYEPPVSVNGSAPTRWVARYDRELAAGRPVSALVTALKGMGGEPLFSAVPRFVLVPMLGMGLRRPPALAEDEVAIADLIPTLHYDMHLVREMADTVTDYAALPAHVLLLGGSRSPAYFDVALRALSAVLPRSRRITFRGLGHTGPEDEGDPAGVGQALRDFFTPPDD